MEMGKSTNSGLARARDTSRFSCISRRASSPPMGAVETASSGSPSSTSLNSDSSVKTSAMRLRTSRSTPRLLRKEATYMAPYSGTSSALLRTAQ